VCQELFLTETAALAHVVLPAASAMEKAGTFTNTEGHVQAVRPAIDPVGDSRPDWEILSALSVFMGTPLEYDDAKDILKEIRAVIPGYGSLGPTPIPPSVDPVAVDRYVHEGYRRDIGTRYTLPARTVRPEGTVQLGLTQSLFHSGKLSTHSKGLLQIEPSGFLQMNPAAADYRQLLGKVKEKLARERGFIL
jgi:formate dehydrogenase alpha subunit